MRRSAGGRTTVFMAALAVVLLFISACGGGGQPVASETGGAGAPAGESGGSEQAQGPLWGGTITTAFAEDATTLDPAVCYDSVCWNSMRDMFDRLLDYDRDTSNLVPQAAESMPEVTNDSKTYVFHLRKGMKFWNGQEITADDVIYSLTRILDPKVQSPVLGFWSSVEGAQAYTSGQADSVAGFKKIDDYTVEIDLSKPNSAFPYVVAMPQASIIPKGSADSGDFAHHPIGSGPFILKEWLPGQSMEFDRNPNYWDAPKPYVDKIVYRLNVSPDVAFLQLQKGEVDLLGDGIPNSQILTVQDAPAFQPLLVHRDLQSTYFITLNTQMKPFDDPRVRKAVALALDRDFLFKLIHGQGEIADGLIPPGVTGYSKDLPHIQQDIEQAKQLLAQAGHPDGFTTDLYSWNTEPWTTLDAAIAQQLGQIGINVKVNAIAENAFFGLAATPKTTPMTVTFWIADFPDASDFFNALVGCAAAVKGGQNYAFYCNKDMDTKVDEALAASDSGARDAAYHQAELMLLNDLPIIPLFHTVKTGIHGERVMNYFENPTWAWDMANYWLKDGSPTPPGQ